MSQVIVIAEGFGNTGPDLNANNEYLFAQSFVAPSYFIVDFVRLRFVTWQGDYDGQIETKFYHVDGEYRPLGGAFISRKQSFNLVGTQAPTYHQLDVTIASGWALLLGVPYIFTFKMEIGDNANNFFWPYVLPYTAEPDPAEMLQSFDDGETWTDQIWRSGLAMEAPGDMHFAIWGQVVPSDYRQPLPVYPADRPDDYEPDDIWQPGEWQNGEWQNGQFASDYQAAGGGRWGQQLVVAGNDRIYYEERE